MRSLPLVALVAVLSMPAAAAIRVGDETPVTSSVDLAPMPASDLRVASNGESHYAIWRDANRNQFGILLGRYGEPQGATRAAFANRLLYDVASGSRAFFIVGRRTDNVRALTVRRVEADGTLAREVAITADAGDYAHIATNGTRVFVTYEQASDGAIRGAVFNSSLDLLTNNFSITAPRQRNADYAIAVQGDHILAAWVSDAGGAGAAFVDTRGNLTPLDLVIDSGFTAPQLAASDSDFRLIWRGATDMLNVLTVDAKGKPGELATAVPQIASGYGIDYDGIDYWLAYTLPTSCENRFDVVLRNLTGGGPATTVSAETPALSGWTPLVHTSDRFHFAAWIGARCGDANTSAMGRLAFAGPISSFSLGIPDQTQASIANVDGVLTTVWREAGAIRIARAGQPSAVVAASGTNPRIARNLVVWVDNGTVFGRFADLQSNAFVIGAAAEYAAVDYVNGEYLVAWNHGTAYVEPSGLVVPLAPVSAAGALDVAFRLVVWSDGTSVFGRFVDGEPFAIGSGTSPRAACNGSDCVVTWSAGAQSFARRLADADATVLAGSTVPIFDGFAFRLITDDGGTVSVRTYGAELATEIVKGVTGDVAAAPGAIAYGKTSGAAMRAFLRTFDEYTPTRRRAAR
jgi:hypothetical protein